MRKIKLGLLGGGQLGRMLLKPAAELGIDVSVFDKDQDSPCRAYVADFRSGNLMSAKEVFEFGKTCTHVTIEFEHVSAEGLKQLSQMGVIVYPQAEILSLIQDKGAQKNFYHEKKIPTAEFILLNSVNEFDSKLFPYPFMVKSRTQGYDGHGVKKVKNRNELNSVFPGPVVVEKIVDIRHEISVIVARNSAGEIKSYAPVLLAFSNEKNILDELISPAELDEHILQDSISLAMSVANAFGIVGLLAVEMFLTRSGELLVNEVAPRPHNSGHHTIECAVTSQYEQHLRAVLGLPLGDTHIHTPSIMMNILGEPGFSGSPQYNGLEEVMRLPGVHIHLYGKGETRPFRKMGHVTIAGENLTELRKVADRVKKTLRVTA